MNRVTKGAIATGAGVLLLLGGGGTLALWNTDKDITAGTVTAGKLDLTSDVEGGTWTVTNGPRTLTNVNMSEYRIVPGDIATFEQTVTVDIEGDNNYAEITMNDAAAVDGFDVGSIAPVITLTDTNSLLAVDNVLDQTDDQRTITAKATFRFSDNVVVAGNMNNAGSGDTYKFGTRTFTLQQIAPLAP
jgi:alternate signal-mediated exported protein